MTGKYMAFQIYTVPHKRESAGVCNPLHTHYINTHLYMCEIGQTWAPTHRRSVIMTKALQLISYSTLMVWGSDCILNLLQLYYEQKKNTTLSLDQFGNPTSGNRVGRGKAYLHITHRNASPVLSLGCICRAGLVVYYINRPSHSESSSTAQVVKTREVEALLQYIVSLSHYICCCSVTPAMMSEGKKTALDVCSNLFVIVILQMDVAVSPWRIPALNTSPEAIWMISNSTS